MILYIGCDESKESGCCKSPCCQLCRDYNLGDEFPCAPDPFSGCIQCQCCFYRTFTDKYGSCPITATSQSAHAVIPALDTWTPSNTEPIVSPLFQVDLYLVPILAILVFILSCCQCWMLRKRRQRNKSKRNGAARIVDYDSEMGLDEAKPIN